MTTIIAETLDQYAQAQGKPFTSDRSLTVGASEVGQCMRKTFWIKQELSHKSKKRVDRDPEHVDSWGARMRGTMFEQYFWEPAMRARFNGRLLYAGKDQRTLVNGYLSATPDGLIVNLTRKEKMLAETGANCIVAECKTLDPRADASQAKMPHVMQTHVQIGLFRELTPHRPERAVLSYTDTSFWSETSEFVVKYDPLIYAHAKDRADRIMRAEAGRDLEPEGWITGGHECRYCPFTKACGVERRSLPYAETPPSEIDLQFIAEMTDLARKYKSATMDRDLFDNMARALQDQIKNRLREKSVRKIPGVLSWTNVKGRTSYDNEAMMAELARRGVDTAQYQTVGEASDRLTISVGGNGAAGERSRSEK